MTYTRPVTAVSISPPPSNVVGDLSRRVSAVAWSAAKSGLVSAALWLLVFSDLETNFGTLWGWVATVGSLGFMLAAVAWAAVTLARFISWLASDAGAGRGRFLWWVPVLGPPVGMFRLSAQRRRWAWMYALGLAAAQAAVLSVFFGVWWPLRFVAAPLLLAALGLGAGSRAERP